LYGSVVIISGGDEVRVQEMEEKITEICNYDEKTFSFGAEISSIMFSKTIDILL